MIRQTRVKITVKTSGVGSIVFALIFTVVCGSERPEGRAATAATQPRLAARVGHSSF